MQFIGPKAEHIRLMGDKIEAKRTALRLGIPVVPGSDGGVTSDSDALAIARDIGFPILVKAAAGGGGRGMTPDRQNQFTPGRDSLNGRAGFSVHRPCDRGQRALWSWRFSLLTRSDSGQGHY